MPDTMILSGAPPEEQQEINHKTMVDQTDVKMPGVQENPNHENQSGKEPEEKAMTNRPGTRISLKKQDTRVVSIDAQPSVETASDKAMNDLMDLIGSLRSKRILTGTIQGVETSEQTGDPRAVIYYGGFKILIPSAEAVNPPEDFRDRSKNEVYKYLITKRLGAEVDFLVKGIDPDSGIVAASRKEAMAMKRRQFYLGKDRDGNNLLYEDCIAEARVISVIRAGAFVELFGVESYIPARELSYQRLIDVSSAFYPGQRVLVKVLTIDKTNPDNIHVRLSVKQAQANPYDSVLTKFAVGSYYVGTVSVMDTNGIFVSLEGGVDCLCQYPKRGVPVRGSRVTVRILHINEDNKRIFAEIIYVSGPAL